MKCLPTRSNIQWLSLRQKLRMQRHLSLPTNALSPKNLVLSPTQPSHCDGVCCVTHTEAQPMKCSCAMVLFAALSGCLRDPPRSSAREPVSVASPLVVPPPVAPATSVQSQSPQELPPLRQPVRWVVRTTGASETERLPLVIAIHGLGDTVRILKKFRKRFATHWSSSV
jgi:hypothetical protein